MFKKIFIGIITLIFVFSVGGCKNQKNEKDVKNSSNGEVVENNEESTETVDIDEKEKEESTETVDKEENSEKESTKSVENNQSKNTETKKSYVEQKTVTKQESPKAESSQQPTPNVEQPAVAENHSEPVQEKSDLDLAIEQHIKDGFSVTYLNGKPMNFQECNSFGNQLIENRETTFIRQFGCYSTNVGSATVVELEVTFVLNGETYIRNYDVYKQMMNN